MNLKPNKHNRISFNTTTMASLGFIGPPLKFSSPPNLIFYCSQSNWLVHWYLRLVFKETEKKVLQPKFLSMGTVYLQNYLLFCLFLIPCAIFCAGRTSITLIKPKYPLNTTDIDCKGHILLFSVLKLLTSYMPQRGHQIEGGFLLPKS